MTATIMPATTNTTIAICIHTHIGDICAAYRVELRALGGRALRWRRA